MTLPHIQLKIAPQLEKIKRWSDIPAFPNEKKEAEFWQSHELDASLLSESLMSTDQSDSTAVSIRFDPRMLSRLKRLARSRYLNYQSMIKQWLAERLEQETRNS
jgi:predicted DNA binding CopG/RHH family protein